MKKILFSLVLFFSLFNFSDAEAQYINKGFWGGVELDYGLSLSDRGTGYKQKFRKGSRMQMTSVRSVMGYYIVPSFSLGTGVGLSTYSKQRVNTIPIFIDCRIHPLAQLNENFYVNINVGTFLGDNQKHIDSKVFWEASVGYKLFDFGSCNLAPVFGYQFYRYSIDQKGIEEGVVDAVNQNRRTLFFRLSLTY